MNRIQIFSMVVFSLILTSCMNTTNGPVYRDGWKGRHVDEFSKEWQGKGYSCGKRKAREDAGIVECYIRYNQPICPKTIRKGAVYNLATERILGKSSHEVTANCF